MTDQLEYRLLDFLSRRLASPSLSYIEKPTQLQGGFESLIYSFALAGVPGEFSGPLILRVLRRLQEPARARREAVIHNTIHELGFPAPRVLLAVTSTEALGAPFLIMRRVAGRTLAAEFEGLGRGRSMGETLLILLRTPQILSSAIALMAETQVRLHRLRGDALLRAFEREHLDQRLLTLDGRLDALVEKTRCGPLAELGPAVDWLVATRPAEAATLTICHGDFQPFNILVVDGAVTGVIDWVNAMVAEPALDVGITVGSFATVPVSVPLILKRLFYAIMRLGRRAYLKAYNRISPLEPGRVTYYEAVRCLNELVSLGDGMVRGETRLGAFQSAEGVDRLIAHLHRLTGLRVRFPSTLYDRVSR